MRHRLVAPGCEWLGPFAETRIKVLLGLGIPYADQSFEVNGYTVRVQVTPGHEYIRIDGGGVVYEFLCSDSGYTELDDGRIGIPGATNPFAPDYLLCTGSGVRMTRKTTPVFSQSLTDQQTPERWPYVTIEYILTHGSVVPPAEYGTFYTFASRPSQSFQSYHWWLENKPNALVTSVCATGNGRSWTDRLGRLCSMSLDITYQVDAESTFGPCYRHTETNYYAATGITTVSYKGGYDTMLGGNDGLGYYIGNLRKRSHLSSVSQYIYLRSSPITRYSWVNSNITAEETLVTFGDAEFAYTAARRVVPAVYHEIAGVFDVPPCSYTNNYIYYAGAKRTQQANWRHAAVHIATDETGVKHPFFVSTDTHGVFTFYRRTAYALDNGYNTNLPEEMVKVVRVSYPPWVTVVGDTASTSDDHWQWKFNKSATLACTTPLNREECYIYLALTDAAGPYGREVTVSTPKATDRLWPTLFRGGTTPVPTRLKVFRRKDGSIYTGGELILLNFQYGHTRSNHLHGVEYMGKLIPISFAGAIYRVSDFDSFVGLNRDEMEPEKNITPGFVEVGIHIQVISQPDGTVDYFPTVTVVDSEQYSDHSAFFMDCAYYIDNPKGSATPEGITINSDDLLTGEIEVFSSGTTSLFASDLYTGLRQYGLEAMALGGLSTTDTHAFYTVRRRVDKSVVYRIALMRGMDFIYGCINERDYADYANLNTACFYCTVEQADLRFLSFLTASYSRRSALLPLPLVDSATTGYDPPLFYASGLVKDPVAHTKLFPHLLRPRFELRIGWSPPKTVDYSRPEVTGFSGGVDHAMDTSLPEGVIDRAADEVFSSAYLALKHYIAHNHFKITNNDTFSFSPDGSWSVYADRRSSDIEPREQAVNLITGPMPLHDDTTEKSGVFDIITPAIGKSTTHKAAFNKAFGQDRDYSFYNPSHDHRDLGGFGRAGIWTPKQE